MANDKFTELPTSGPFDGAEIVAHVQGGVSKQTTLSNMINSDNLPFVSGQLDTIQDIDTNASPVFLGGFQSYQQNVLLVASGDVDSTLVGKTIFNAGASAIVVTIPVGETLPDNSEFDVIRIDTGAFSVEAEAGVTLNGVDGGSFILSQQYDRAVVKKILSDVWTVAGYSEAVGNLTLQDGYDNGTGVIFCDHSKPFVIAANNPGDGKMELVDTSNPRFSFDYKATTYVPGEITGTLRFTANNDAASQSTISKIVSSCNDFTNGSVSSRLLIDAKVSGTETQFISLNDNNNSQVELYEKTVINDTGSSSTDSSSVFEVVSTTKGSLPFSSMTEAQFDSISTPANGLGAWNTDSNRFRINNGTPGAPTYEEIAYLSDVQSGDTQQEVYDNSLDGNIDLSAGKHWTVSSTTAGSRPFPSMTEIEFDSIATPPNGLMGWDTDSDRIRVNKGTAGSPDYGEVAYLSDVDVAIDSNFGEMYFNNNSTDTAISAANTPVKVAGTYNSGMLADFTQVSGTLTHTGTTRTFHVTATATVDQNLDTNNISLLLYKNGSVIAKSRQSVFVGPSSPAEHAITAQCLVSLANTDTVEVFVENNDDNSDILISQLSCIATQTGAKVGGGADAEAGDPGLTIGTETGTSGTIINSMFYQRIEDIVYIQADLLTTPTDSTNSVNINVPFTENFTDVAEAAGTGSYAPASFANRSNSDVQVLGTCATPRIGYSIGSYEDVVQVYNGSNTIKANTLKVGDMVEYEVVGRVNKSASGSQHGNLEVLIAGLAVTVSPNLSDSSGSGSSCFRFTFRLRVDSIGVLGTYVLSADGNYTRGDGSIHTIGMHGTGAALNFNTENDNDISLRYRQDSGSGSQIKFIADSVTIKKYNNVSDNTPSMFRGITANVGAQSIETTFRTNPNNFNRPQILSLAFSYQIQ